MAITFRLCLAALALRAAANPVPTPPPLGTAGDDCLLAPSGGHHLQIPGAGLGCAAPAPNCTFTTVITVSPLPILGSGAATRTVFNSTATSTSHLDCKGCTALAVSTIDFLNPGPVINVTTTVTATGPAAVTDYVCLKSPSISTGSPPHMTPAPHMGPAVVAGDADEGPDWTSITPPKPPPFPTSPRSVTSTINLPPVPPPPPFIPRG